MELMFIESQIFKLKLGLFFLNNVLLRKVFRCFPLMPDKLFLRRFPFIRYEISGLIYSIIINQLKLDCDIALRIIIFNYSLIDIFQFLGF